MADSQARQHYGADWWDYAACVGMDPELWQPGNGSPQFEERRLKKARFICRRCPVREECLVYAVRTEQRVGVWGGMTVQERAHDPGCRKIRQAASGLKE